MDESETVETGRRTVDQIVVDGPAGAVGRGLPGRPVVVGEVLFDHFPDGSRVLGGAPFNLAWHLQAVGLEPLLITRVGADREGAEVLEAMAGWGLDVSGVQVDQRHPTGVVHVRFDRGEPTFEIPPDQAWDHLEPEPALAAVDGQPMAVLCHGSLIAREARSRAVLAAVRARTALPVFVDVNLRDPFWTETGVGELLAGTRWVKLNGRELQSLVGPASDAVEEGAARLRERWVLDQVWVTRGGAGALVDSSDGLVAARPPSEVAVVDTVGAGDAFSAVVVAALVWGWPPERTLREALGFAARVCTLRGATGRDRGLYAELERAREATGEKEPAHA